MKRDSVKAMKRSNKDKKIHPAYQDGIHLLCSRCFGSLGEIIKYGHDNQGYWFIAPCKECGTKMKWYRTADGKTKTDAIPTEDGTFGLTLMDGELTMVWINEGEKQDS